METFLLKKKYQDLKKIVNYEDNEMYQRTQICHVYDGRIWKDFHNFFTMPQILWVNFLFSSIIKFIKAYHIAVWKC